MHKHIESQKTIPSKPKAMVGISGGVDSAVAAYLLQERGYQVTGVFVKSWDNNSNKNTNCSAEFDLDSAISVCNHLNIDLITVDLINTYYNKVFTDFINDLHHGLTPNPDLMCNRYVKFGQLWDYVVTQQDSVLATGHYAKLDDNNNLYVAHDAHKDQSYFLAAVKLDNFKNVIFPLGEYAKPAIREIAKKIGLPNHDRPDSTGVCFIGPDNFNNFISNYHIPKPGNIIDLTGNIIGKHKGLIYYTNGQRQGLAIGGNNKGNGEPWYVVRKDIKSNTIVVAQGTNHPALFHHSLICNELNNLTAKPIHTYDNVKAKIRSRQERQKCSITLSPAKNDYIVTFTNPQKSITPGQYVVFYQNDLCLGCGRIINSESNKHA